MKGKLPELPSQKKARFIASLGLPEYDAEVLTSEREIADYFEECLQISGDPKKTSNWVKDEVLGIINKDNLPINKFKIEPTRLGSMIKMIASGEISGKIAKTVFEEMLNTTHSPSEIVARKGLSVVRDDKELEIIIEKVLEENSEAVNSYKKGKEKAFGSLVGAVMKHTKGKADPAIVNKLLKDKLGN